MKELTTQEKAKRFDEALEKARRYYDEYVSRDNILYVEDMEDMFPELKESECENESIRKYLYSFVELNSGVNLPPEEAKEILAWLEKQGEQKPTEWHREDEQNLNACLGYIPDEFLRRWLKDAVHVKYDKVEPKFKIGDWVVNKFGDVWHIDSFDKKNYQVSNGNEYNYFYFPISKQDEMHLWTINDAKDGDVLATDSWLYIFKYTNNKAIIQFYCNCPINGKPYKWCFLSDDSYLDIYEEANIHPATKEQCDLLFQKMHEAGYEWDAEKKELKKIVKKSIEGTFINVDEVRENFVKEVYRILANDTTNDRANDIIYYFDSLPTIYLHTNKPLSSYGDDFDMDYILKNHAWSEEDERNFKSIMKIIKEKAFADYDVDENNNMLGIYGILETWLKSLKDRYNWKPSDEQLHYLSWIANIKLGDSVVEQEVSKHLNELLEDLKKFREV